MKFLGKVKDPKDLTTKEYVDDADKRLQESTTESLSKLDKKKLNTEDVTSFTETEIKYLWSKYIK